MFTVIAFDIVDDKVRYRVVKILRRYAKRVQKSVFESASLGEKDFARMREQIERVIDPGVDAVRYYFLCRSCSPRTELSGIGSRTVETPFLIA